MPPSVQRSYIRLLIARTIQANWEQTSLYFTILMQRWASPQLSSVGVNRSTCVEPNYTASLPVGPSRNEFGLPATLLSPGGFGDEARRDSDQNHWTEAPAGLAYLGLPLEGFGSDIHSDRRDIAFRCRSGCRRRERIIN